MQEAPAGDRRFAPLNDAGLLTLSRRVRAYHDMQFLTRLQLRAACSARLCSSRQAKPLYESKAAWNRIMSPSDCWTSCAAQAAHCAEGGTSVSREQDFAGQSELARDAVHGVLLLHDDVEAEHPATASTTLL